MEPQLDIYFDTTSLPAPELKAAEEAAKSQNALILQLFRDNPNRTFTPCEVHHDLGVGKWNTPLTSIRRAITTLTKLGYLERTNEKRLGWYGRKSYAWRLLIKNDE